MLIDTYVVDRKCMGFRSQDAKFDFLKCQQVVSCFVIVITVESKGERFCLALDVLNALKCH